MHVESQNRSEWLGTNIHHQLAPMSSCSTTSIFTFFWNAPYILTLRTCNILWYDRYMWRFILLTLLYIACYFIIIFLMCHSSYEITFIKHLLNQGRQHLTFKYITNSLLHILITTLLNTFMFILLYDLSSDIAMSACSLLNHGLLI